MSAALFAMAYAAVETELAGRHRRAGNEERQHFHAGWAAILIGVGFFCALNHWIFG